MGHTWEDKNPIDAGDGRGFCGASADLWIHDLQGASRNKQSSKI